MTSGGGAKQSGFLSREAVLALGFASVGQDVRIDENARFYGADRISLGSHVRIDAFAVLSAGAGGIIVGDHVHLSVGVILMGAARIEVGNFVCLSARVAVFSSNDDYLGGALTGPMVPDALRNTTDAPVTVEPHVIVGAGTVVLPGVTVGRGAAVGALSLVSQDVAPLAIVVGTSGRMIGSRPDRFAELEARLGRMGAPARTDT